MLGAVVLSICLALIFAKAWFTTLKLVIDLIILARNYKKWFDEESRRKVVPGATYVALGSSFAAGPSVGEPIEDGFGYSQGTKSYPFVLGAQLGLSEPEVRSAASSFAVVDDVLKSQLRHLGASTRLVTVTIGGNDVNYTKDTIWAALLNTAESPGLAKLLRGLAPFEPVEARPFRKLRDSMIQLFAEVKRRAPAAVVVAVTYPAILPPTGVLPPLTQDQSDTLRNVAEKLAATTREAAKATDIEVVDMATISQDHHALADVPWSLGIVDSPGRAHPNEAGHAATAERIYALVSPRFTG